MLSNDNMSHFEGVDDNGAGVAAMLEVVRQVTDANKKGVKRKNTIMFVSFDAEELCMYSQISHHRKHIRADSIFHDISNDTLINIGLFRHRKYPKSPFKIWRLRIKIIITKTRLFKCIENFISENWKFSDKNSDIFSHFCSKHRLWVLVRTASARRF